MKERQGENANKNKRNREEFLSGREAFDSEIRREIENLESQEKKFKNMKKSPDVRKMLKSVLKSVSLFSEEKKNVTTDDDKEKKEARLAILSLLLRRYRELLKDAQDRINKYHELRVKQMDRTRKVDRSPIGILYDNCEDGYAAYYKEESEILNDRGEHTDFNFYPSYSLLRYHVEKLGFFVVLPQTQDEDEDVDGDGKDEDISYCIRDTGADGVCTAPYEPLFEDMLIEKGYLKEEERSLSRDKCDFLERVFLHFDQFIDDVKPLSKYKMDKETFVAEFRDVLCERHPANPSLGKFENESQEERSLYQKAREETRNILICKLCYDGLGNDKCYSNIKKYLLSKGVEWGCGQVETLIQKYILSNE